jgi:hypothetical protein
MRPELITHSSVPDRDLYFLSVGRSDLFPESISISSQNFAVFLALDATDLDTDDISNMARKLLHAGAAYFCCYGHDCERVHDVIDEEILHLDLEKDGSVIMTSWHNHETLLEALWFFVFNSFPDDKYLNSCKAGIAISCGSSNWDNQIIGGLKDLAESKAH